MEEDQTKSGSLLARFLTTRITSESHAGFDEPSIRPLGKVWENSDVKGSELKLRYLSVLG